MTPKVTIPSAVGMSMRATLVCAMYALCLATAMPAVADDISNGSWHTVDDSNDAAPPNGWPAGMFPNQVEPAARAMMGGVARWWERGNPSRQATWSAGNYTISTHNTAYPTAYEQGEIICGKASAASAGNDTLQVNTLAALPLYVSTTSGFVKVATNAIQLHAQFCASYDSALNSDAGGWQILTALANANGSGTPTSPVLLDSGNVSTGSTTILSKDLSSYVSSYSRFEIKLNHVNCGNSSTVINVRFSLDGGSTWLTTGYTWQSASLSSTYSVTNSTGTGDTTEIQIEGPLAFVNGTIALTKFAGTSTLLQGTLGNGFVSYITGGLMSTIGVNGVLITTTGGTVSAGKYDLIGYP